MSTTPQDAIPLEYAPPPPDSIIARIWRRSRTALAILFSGVFGAVIGLWLTPQTYEANWLYFPSSVSAERIAEVQRELSPHVDLLQSPAVLDAVQADLATGLTPLPAGEAGREILRRGLTIKPIPNTKVIGMTFRSRDMTLAPNVLRSYQTQMSMLNGAKVRQVTRMSVSASRSPVGAIAGFCAASIAAAFLFLWHGRRRVAHDALRRP